MKITSLFAFCFLVYFSFFVNKKCLSQNNHKSLIQFSGVVLEVDSLRPASFSTIIVKGTSRGTVSDYYGFFSFVAFEGDTIEFSHIGYKKARYIIPDSLQEARYSLIQILQTDTVLLKETVVYPWPTKEQFKEAFLNMNIPDDDLVRAQRNLSRVAMADAAQNLPMDGSLAHKQTLAQFNSRLYYAGQLPPNNLLNPIAWSKFIEAWRRGDFKKKE
ncbi:MAG: carboxypeptidase-like regulatory domain-containing protein [Bacteroidetes bacterium]|nr:carboxypeptidase-like regulatory domain-containing protein [Bacteroidota bacterium]MBV6460142.1 hypothetical protein [Flavobacteriales bacterium]WKZ74013.1 MAG: carboxypeptidase-like regulatory domain-containing protein [Vicingaceae bacterium]MCL4817412.1 carboxypeptidase-like regulatory domain-containing protein [Flavobacteriales bacterium]NOG96049.1 carboxypeptidase-like regulatory domain-containing protein [Bacteroidota bacterium]